VVLPKRVRDRLGLRAGSPLEMTETPDGVTLKMAEQGSPLARVGKLLVYTGEVPADFDIVKAIDEEREARDWKNLGYRP